MGTSPTRVLDYRAPDIISDVGHMYQTGNRISDHVYHTGSRHVSSSLSSGRYRSDTSNISLDTCTTVTGNVPTPVSLNSSTHAIIQPSGPLHRQYEEK